MVILTKKVEPGLCRWEQGRRPIILTAVIGGVASAGAAPMRPPGGEEDTRGGYIDQDDHQTRE